VLQVLEIKSNEIVIHDRMIS